MDTLDQGPSTKAIVGSGPQKNSPITRTWKRITLGPKIATLVTEETHVGSKRRSQDHEQNELENNFKKKKTDMEMVEISRMMAMEFNETAAAAWQSCREQ